MADQHFDKVRLLALNRNNVADATTVFTDQSKKRKIFTVVNGDSQFDTAQAPTGMNVSLLCDGTGDGIGMVADVDFGFKTQTQFTIECMARLTSFTGNPCVIDMRDAAGTDAQFVLFVNAGNSSARVFANNTLVISGGANTAILNTWQHWVYQRSNFQTTHLFIDGVSVGSFIDGINYIPGKLRIGCDLSGTAVCNGHISNVRITVGVARYPISGFTPMGAASRPLPFSETPPIIPYLRRLTRMPVVPVGAELAMLGEDGTEVHDESLVDIYSEG